MGHSLNNWLAPQMRVYVVRAIAKTRDIKCEKCGALEGLEMHHTAYAPHQNVGISDIQILCHKCHRNSETSLSSLRTVFEDGKRFCEIGRYRFQY